MGTENESREIATALLSLELSETAWYFGQQKGGTVGKKDRGSALVIAYVDSRSSLEVSSLWPVPLGWEHKPRRFVILARKRTKGV